MLQDTGKNNLKFIAINFKLLIYKLKDFGINTYIQEIKPTAMNIIKPFILALTIILFAAYCKSPVGDPCIDQFPFKADFAIHIKNKYSKAKDGDTLLEIKDGDTCLADYIKFSAKENKQFTNAYDSVRWFVGNSQNTSTQKEYQLQFLVSEYRIPIKFIGYKKRSYVNCFPDVSEVQTVTKTISVVNPSNSIPIVGDFFGYNEDSPTDTFTISTQFESKRNFFVIKNFPKGNRGW